MEQHRLTEQAVAGRVGAGLAGVECSVGGGTCPRSTSMYWKAAGKCRQNGVELVLALWPPDRPACLMDSMAPGARPWICASSHFPSHPPCWDSCRCPGLASAVNAWHLLRRALPCSQVTFLFRLLLPYLLHGAHRPNGTVLDSKRNTIPTTCIIAVISGSARRMPIGTIWRCLATELRHVRCLSS